MKLLVTGAAGFIGSNFVRRLLTGAYPNHTGAPASPSSTSSPTRACGPTSTRLPTARDTRSSKGTSATGICWPT
ncbi:MAG: NAD-dependent epimerase/dehydratase family protein [Candidatus Nanopelagicales bacterium]